MCIRDRPCSGLGVLAKKPDIRQKTLDGLDGLVRLQRAILVFLIFTYEGNGMFSQRMDVALPNFLGLTQAEIQEKYPDSKFIFQTEEEYNTEYAAGRCV